ncbi:MAG: type II secretory pathway component PulM [Saprospiraceae bacterium]|jgi:type II secretory pathway component PulM
MTGLFSSITERERNLLIFAGLFTAAIIFYLYLWEPKMKELNDYRQNKLPESAQTLAWVKQALGSVNLDELGKQPKKIQGPLLTVLEQTAETVEVRASIQRVQPDQNQSVKVWLTNVEFDSWLNWLELLKVQGVIVQSAGVVKKTPGIVDIRMTVGRN